MRGKKQHEPYESRESWGHTIQNRLTRNHNIENVVSNDRQKTKTIRRQQADMNNRIVSRAPSETGKDIPNMDHRVDGITSVAF